MFRDRAIAAALAVLILLVAAIVLYRQGPGGLSWFPGCSFHRLTGLSCPGCGMTRAVHAALHGRIAEAFRFNPLGMILVPAFLVWLGFRLPAWLRGEPTAPWPRSTTRWIGWTLGLVLVFWVIRNIPVWPFVLLSPG